VVSLGQQIDSVDAPLYTAKGTLGEGQRQYAWEQDSTDKLSMYMLSAIQSSSTAARFQGLGAALLEQLAANGGQRISQSGLAISNNTPTDPLLLGLQQARLREHATSSVSFNLTTASGATVTLGLYSSAADVQGGTLSGEELKGLAAMADSFQSALNGLSQEPPRLQLGTLVKLDPKLFAGLQLNAKLENANGDMQTFDLQLDDHTRSLKLQGPSGEVKMNLDTQGGALLGVEGLAFSSIDGHHRTVHGGVDAGIAQLGLVAAQAGLGLADLGLEHVDACLGDLELCLGSLHVLVTRGASGGQVTLALELVTGELELRALFG